MLNCWQENPDDRPSFTDLVQYFGDVIAQLTEKVSDQRTCGVIAMVSASKNCFKKRINAMLIVIVRSGMSGKRNTNWQTKNCIEFLYWQEAEGL